MYVCQLKNDPRDGRRLIHQGWDSIVNEGFDHRKVIHSRAVIVDRRASEVLPLKKGFESEGLSDCGGISRGLGVQTVESSLTLLEAMRLSLEFQNVTMMSETVQKRPEQAFVLENLRPI